MLALIIVYVVLMAAVVALYVMSQRLRKGPRQGFWQWLKTGLFSGNGMAPSVDDRRATSLQTANSEKAAEVVAVLEDIYEEFLSETAKLRKEFQSGIASLESTWKQQLDGLREDVKQLQQRLEQFTRPSDAAEGVESELGFSRTVSNASDVYFSILDELHAGTPPVQIAAKLGVTLDEVARVREIMESPGITAEPH